jgi:hypothetical protein
VLLLVLAGLGVLVTEDEVNLKYCQLMIRREPCLGNKALISYLVGSTTLVGTEHDHVGSSVGELLGVELLVLLEELHVGTTANKGVFLWIGVSILRAIAGS